MIRRHLIPSSSWLCLCFGLWSCGSDERLSGGTSGTQTGNALQARILLSDGHPAANARVVARHAQASDSSAPTIETTTDPAGRFEMHLDDGDWSVEASLPGTGVRKDFHLSSDTVLPPDTLLPCGTLEGTVEGLQPGQSLSILGLGRRVVPDASGRFRFDSLPRGTHPLRLLGSASSWSVVVASGRTDTLLLDVQRSGEIFSAAGSVSPSSRTGVVLLSQSGFGSFRDPLSSLEWTDSRGEVLPALALDMDPKSGILRAWVKPPVSGDILCRKVLSGQARHRSPFSGYRVALVFPASMGHGDSLATDSVLNFADSSRFTGFSPASAFQSFPGEGRIRRSPLGSALASLSGANLPSKPGWTMILRAGLENPDIGRIWLLDWSDDSTGEGLKIGIGAGSLELVAPGIDTTVSIPGVGDFHDWTITSDGETISVGIDGRTSASIRFAAPGPRWSRGWIGVGGGIRLSRLFVWDGPSPP